MVNTPPGMGYMLRMSRIFSAPRQRVFDVWTQPEHLSRWWGIQNDYTAAIVEVDLRVGGHYRLGMKAPDDSLHVVVGEFREVVPPEKLVYTWSWEQGMPDTMEMGDTLVTIEFLDRGDSTEMILTHELFPTEEVRDLHAQGWTMMLENTFGPALDDK
ncbi:MAG: SRPBCC domain-containing protein [Chloroflexi bacterium]|nr:SRPBCC domain-containing protein [Chloroflexota bacterium]MDA1226757.1 SRPBCC domain-containing protein [Chloroflexota bacterium]